MQAVMDMPPAASAVSGPRFGFRKIAELQRDPLTMLTAVKNTYGDLVRIQLPLAKAYLVSDPALIEQVLLRDHHVFHKDPLTRELRFLLGDGLLTSEGDKWKRVRKLASPPLTKRAITAYADAMVEIGGTYASFPTGVSRNIHDDMQKLTLAIVTRTLFGTDLPSGAENVGDALHTAMDYFLNYTRSMKRLIPKWLPIPAHLRMRKARNTIDATVMQVIAQRRAAASDEAIDLISLLLKARDDEGSGLTDRQLRDEAITIFLAGHETTALALAYGLMLLAQHPEIQAKAHAEVDTVLAGRKASAADYPRLSFLDQIITETMRLYPPAWVVAREPSEVYDLAGLRIGTREQVWISQWIVHRDARWFPEPDAFKPERWTADMREQLPRFAYFPFGGGPRICIGNHFAQMEAVLVLATLLQARSYTQAPDHELRLECSVTMRPAKGVRLIPHARAQSSS